MNTILWILQGLLSLIFIMPGFGKLFSTKQQHIANGHITPENSVIPIRILGVLEWLGCIGIIVPWLFGFFPILTPVSAVGFGLVMLGGILMHAQKKEYKMLPMLITILFISATVAYFRFQQV